tara:strand:+ start:67 stop:309 length:243 start_codon:yes stop_codon:yes gene_type:complete
MVEQCAHNAKVGGSIPSGTTKQTTMKRIKLPYFGINSKSELELKFIHLPEYLESEYLNIWKDNPIPSMKDLDEFKRKHRI